MLKNTRNPPRLLALLGAGLLACTSADRRPPLPAQEVRSLSTNNALDVGDVFDVRVFGEGDLTGKHRITAEGTIEYPLIGTLRVAGLLPSEVGQLIASRLKDGILRSPQVSIFVLEQVSKKVHILGQIAKPGTLVYTPGMNIVEAITQAGGFTPLSAKNSTTVTRSEAGKQVIYRVRAGDIGDGTARNFTLHPGDIVSIPERFF